MSIYKENNTESEDDSDSGESGDEGQSMLNNINISEIQLCPVLS